MREMNFQQFLNDLNKELALIDEQMLEAMGRLNKKDRSEGDNGPRSPEEIAKEEAERERMIQESMQKDIIDAVFRKIQVNLDE